MKILFTSLLYCSAYLSGCNGGNTENVPECGSNASCERPQSIPAENIANADPVMPEDCGMPLQSAIVTQEDILGTWSNSERYLINQGDPVERLITFNSENSFQSISTIYNGCPYGEVAEPSMGCDDWYSGEESQNGFYTFESNIVVLYFSDISEEIIVHRIAENSLVVSVGNSCDVLFQRL